MDRSDTFLLGLGCGGLFAMALMIGMGLIPLSEQLVEHEKLITDCERDKPRSIHCVLTAVEESKK